MTLAEMDKILSRFKTKDEFYSFRERHSELFTRTLATLPHENLYKSRLSVINE
jgi:hypothetical protein